MAALFPTPSIENKNRGNTEDIYFVEIFYTWITNMDYMLPYLIFLGMYLVNLKVETNTLEKLAYKKLGKVTTRRKHSKWAKRK